MKLYVTLNSPYSRLARIMVLEKNLRHKCTQEIAATRQKDSPYYKINPSGRVPYLTTNQNKGIEGSRLICAFLDHLDGKPKFHTDYKSTNLELLNLEEQARSTVESGSIWIRELFRPEELRSDKVIEHERQRLKRLIEMWEAQILSPLMNEKFNSAQMTLVCALQLEIWNPKFEWRKGHPKLQKWLKKMMTRKSLEMTIPPGNK